MAVDRRESYCTVTYKAFLLFPPGDLESGKGEAVSGGFQFVHNLQRAEQVKEGKDMKPVYTRFSHTADLDVTGRTNMVDTFQSWDFCAHTPWTITQ